MTSLNKAVKKRIITVLIIIIVVAVLELTLFNRAHYSHLWQGEKSTDFETISMTYENGVYRRKPFSESPEPAAFVFENLDRRVNSVYIELVDTKPDPNKAVQAMNFSVVYGDDDNSRKETPRFGVIAGLEFTHYQEINPYGNTDYIRIVPHNHNFEVKSVAVNVTIPLVFVWGRFLLVALVAVGVYLLLVCDIRKIVFDSENLYQRISLLLVIFSFILLGNLTVSVVNEPYAWLPPAYERMAESIIEGRLDLTPDNPRDRDHAKKLRTLTGLDNPWNPTDRANNGLGTFEWDNAYYDGKIYMQHGIGPVLTVFLPYQLLTGERLPAYYAVFLFGALGAVFLALLWREIVKRYFPKMPFVLFLCTSAAVMWCSLISPSFFYPNKHSVAATSGLMFVALGLFLLFRAAAIPLNAQEDSKIAIRKYIQIFFGCFSVAFAVSCRASTALSSLLVPVILWPLIEKTWKDRGNRLKRFIPLTLCVVIPYLAVALPLMWYNYVRFESITEFGTGYALTGWTNTIITDVNPAAMVRMLVESVRNIFFTPFNFSMSFPFITNLGTLVPDAASPHRMYNSHAGMLNFPIFWMLLFVPVLIRRHKKTKASGGENLPVSTELLRLCVSLFTLGIFTGILSYVLVAAILRYQIDYMFMLCISSLMVGCLAWENLGKKSAFCKMLCFACLISTLIVLPLSNENSPLWNLPADTYAELKRMFTFF